MSRPLEEGRRLMSRHDEGVYTCADPACPVCWLYAPRSPEWEARVRAAYGAARIDSRPTAVRLRDHPSPTGRREMA